MTRPFTIQPLGWDLFDPAFDLATEVFVHGSTLHRALGIGLQEYRDYLRTAFEVMVHEGLSLVAVDAEDTLLGVMIGTDFCGTGETSSPPERFAPRAAITAELCRDYLDQHPRAQGEAVLIDIGAVCAEARGRGIYQALRTQIHHLARSKGYRYAMGELSSAATQKVILERMGHRKVGEIPFDMFEWNGQKPFLGITEPPSLVLSEGCL